MTDQIKNLLPSKEVLARNDIFKLKTGVDTEKLLIYLTAVYHPKSDLSGIKNIIDRKYKAAELAGFPKSGKKIANDDIILGTNVNANQITLAYLKLFRSPTFTQLKMYHDLFYEEISNLQNSREAENDSAADRLKKVQTRDKINDNIHLYSKKIEELEAEFLTEDNSRMLLQDLYADISEGLTFVPSPEIVSQRIKDNKLPLGNFNPYEI